MILHILKRSEWSDALQRGIYEPSTLGSEGIIHCSTAAQTVDTANIFFRGQPDLVLLCIDERRLTAPLKYEAPAAADDARPTALFPHIRGPLNLDAVSRIVDFPCEPDGSFRLPAAIHDA